LTTLQIILAGVSLVFACALQGAVGFGAGLFAIPLMVWAGVDLPSAISVTLGGVVVQTAWNLYRYRDHVRVWDTLPLFFLRVLTLPVGIALLGVLVTYGEKRVKQAIGGMLLLILALQWAFKVKPRQRVGAGWTLLAGCASGLTAGLVGMGGPPAVLWVMAHDWPAKKARAFLWATFLMLAPINAALLVYKFGNAMWGPMLLGLCLAPLVVIGSEAGMRVGGLMSRHHLRSAAFGLLLILALVSILGPWFAAAG
jgi:uncharacterized protein